MDDKITLKLFRFDPTRDAYPYYEHHSVPFKPHMRVLDVLNHLYEQSDVEIGYRWYCGTKKCGECAMMVNGRPLLSCWEPALEQMTCEPLANFPVIRDLVVDTAPYEQVILRLKPLMMRRQAPDFPERIAHGDMDAAHRLSKCIECNACTAAAPVKGIHSNGVDWSDWAGVAALVRFARFVLDPRDETPRKSLAEQAGLTSFPAMTDLHDICPQGIDVLNDALLPSRQLLFGDAKDSGREEPVSTVFIMGERWSGFVCLTQTEKQKLRAEGRLESLTLSEFDEAYRFIA